MISPACHQGKHRLCRDPRCMCDCHFKGVTMKKLLAIFIVVLLSASLLGGIVASTTSHKAAAATEIAPFTTAIHDCHVLANNSSFHCSVLCPQPTTGGPTLAGAGGWNVNDDDSMNLQVTKSRADLVNGESWTITARANDENEALTFTVYATCAADVPV